MEYKIGQIIELLHNNKTIKLKVEEDKKIDCTKCFFNHDKGNCCIKYQYKNMNDAFCNSISRKDKTNIIYKQIK